jgi:hypothetical protein
VLRLCRNLQILGAYGYLGLVKGKKHFLRYIPQAWKQLGYWMNNPIGGRFPELRKLINRIRYQGDSPNRGGGRIKFFVTKSG